MPNRTEHQSESLCKLKGNQASKNPGVRPFSRPTALVSTCTISLDGRSQVRRSRPFDRHFRIERVVKSGLGSEDP